MNADDSLTCSSDVNHAWSVSASTSIGTAVHRFPPITGILTEDSEAGKVHCPRVNPGCLRVNSITVRAHATHPTS